MAGRYGFTLAELLIALALLGLIAAFTIPKILSSSEDEKNRAILRESVSAFAAATRQGLLNEELFANNVTEYYTTHLNAVKICDTDSSAQGCWDPATPNYASGCGNLHAKPGIVLHSGAVVTGFENSCCAEQANALIDANGATGPNEGGIDQLQVQVCIGPDGCFTLDQGNTRRGALGTTCSLDEEYNQVFSSN